MTRRTLWAAVPTLGWAVVWCAPAWAPPQAAPDAPRVRALVQKLDDDAFAVRRQAEEELRQMGIAVVPLLKKELVAGLTLEARRRAEGVIQELSSLRWQVDLGAAFDEGKRTNRPVLVFSTIGELDGFA